MGTEQNKEVIRAALGGGQLLESVTDDATWRIIGNTTFSGTSKGKQDIEAFLGRLFSQLETPGQILLDNLIAEGDYVVLQGRGSGFKTKTGRSYDNNYCWVFRMRDGKISEITEYLDTELVTSAFGA
jgi:ketosteroid isomerase-like protein